jgi:phosphoglycerate dehydrogenase-like enzyme
LKVVIARKAPPEIRRMMRAEFPADWQIVTVPPPSMAEEICDADALIPEGSPVDVELLEQAHNLKIIQTGAGYDNVDIKECSRRGIRLAHAAGVNARAVAEHVLALIFCWYKNIIKLNAAMKSGKFAVDYTGSELCGKVIGVVGLGHIGREVAKIAQAMEMEVIGYHYRQAAEADGIDRMELYQLLKQADIVTVHVALNEQTRHMIGQKEFESMRKDAFFINTSRGAVVDEQALIEALQAGRIAGAGLDVFDIEPLPADSPLGQLENVILTPHNAGEPDALFFHKKRFQFFAENIARVFAGQAPLNELQPKDGEEKEAGKTIPAVILPEGYRGKILLVSVIGDGIEDMVILRSGDLWHREILRSTEAEIRDLGYRNARVVELGGAHLRFEPDGTIMIHGTSEQYGACDKQYAAGLVNNEFPGRRVDIQS